MLRHLKLPIISLLACFCAVVLCAGCSEKEIDLTTPESTIRTYVRAYNAGDLKAMRQCGMAGSLKNVFTREDYDVNSKKVSIPVDGIKFEILEASPGRESVTRMFTTRDTLLSIRFTSRYDREYSKTVVVKLECRRTVYDEDDTWLIL